jgi:hypothetical protein
MIMYLQYLIMQFEQLVRRVGEELGGSLSSDVFVARVDNGLFNWRTTGREWVPAMVDYRGMAWRT